MLSVWRDNVSKQIDEGRIPTPDEMGFPTILKTQKITQETTNTRDGKPMQYTQEMPITDPSNQFYLGYKIGDEYSEFMDRLQGREHKNRILPATPDAETALFEQAASNSNLVKHPHTIDPLHYVNPELANVPKLSDSERMISEINHRNSIRSGELGATIGTDIKQNITILNSYLGGLIKNLDEGKLYGDFWSNYRDVAGRGMAGPAMHYIYNDDNHPEEMKNVEAAIRALQDAQKTLDEANNGVTRAWKAGDFVKRRWSWFCGWSV